MAASQQRLHSIEYIELKNLFSFILELEPKNVTGIFGINGSGKSSIIYSILCLYKPLSTNPNRNDFKLNQFFTNTSHTRYPNSSYKIIHSFRMEQNIRNNIVREYGKADRWKPRYNDRPERDVYFIGLASCVPEIEIEKSESMIRLTTTNLNDDLSNTIKENAGIVLNRNYQEYNSHDYTAKRKKFIGVRNQNVQYSSLAMGAGEQRVFRILEILFRANRYSLIVIDEIDLTLHTSALNQLISIIVRRAAERNLQVIFTSHREELTGRKDINIRHIHQLENKTLCFNETTPDCITRLTGNQIRTLEIFVEDDLSEAIVQKVIEEQNIRRHCIIKRYGAIDNSFSLAAGLFLKGENLDNILILLDGDKYTTDDEKMAQMQKHLTGNEQYANQNRLNALRCIKQYSLPANTSPEQHINNLLRAMNDESEIVETARNIQAVGDRHEYVNRIIRILGYQDNQIGLSKVAEKLSSSENWSVFVEEINNWLAMRITELNLN